jgi:hypothetical protein
MNALVNDQLDRWCTLFDSSGVRNRSTAAAERPAKFGHYIGGTLYPDMHDRDQKRPKDARNLSEDRGRRAGSNAKDKALLRTSKGKGRSPAEPDSFRDAFDCLRDSYGKLGRDWEDANGDPAPARGAGANTLQQPKL